MSKAGKTFADILTGRSDANIPFADLCHLLLGPRVSNSPAMEQPLKPKLPPTQQYST